MGVLWWLSVYDSAWYVMVVYRYTCCRLGIGDHHQQRNADDELNDYLSQAISGRNIDRLKTEHINTLQLTFRDATMETKVR